MIEIIREIGEYSMSQLGLADGDNIALLAEDPGLDMVILIDLRDNFQAALFAGVAIEEFKRSEKGKYLCKQSPSKNSPYFSPTTKLTKEGKSFGIEKAFRRRILGWFKKYPSSQDLICRIGNCLRTDAKSILGKLNDLELDRDKGYLLSIRINDRYVGEIQEFRQIFLDNIFIKYKEFDHKEVYNPQGICSLCGRQGEVFGNTSPFAWYSIDKECYIAGGFDAKKAWRNFCTCMNCTLQLEAGKTYISKYLDRRFAGIQFMLLPHLMLGGPERLKEVLMIYEDFDKRRLSMEEEDSRRVSADENEILSKASEFQDYVAFNFVFYREENARLRILLSVDDIYPSRLKQLFETKEVVEDLPIFTENGVRFSFGALKNLSNPSGDSLKEFLDYTSRIFKSIPVSYYRFVSHAAVSFRKAFANNNLTPKWVLSAFICFLYIQKLNLFRDRREVSSMAQATFPVEGMERVETLFKQFGDTFNSPAKKGVFLLGVLAQNLLDIQWQETAGSTPFRKKMKGLKLRKEDIIKLLPEIQNKLEEYRKNYYRSLEAIISSYLLESQSTWDLNVDEISFYFALGMNLNNAKDSEGLPLFKSAKQEGEEEAKNE